MNSIVVIAENAPRLPHSPWRFALYFYLKSRFTLAAIFVFEAAQAACTIMLPYAIKEIIDAVTLANQTGMDVFTASKDAMILFALLNLGIISERDVGNAINVIEATRLEPSKETDRIHIKNLNKNI